MILKTEAIVLKSIDFRETSRIVTFFTKDYGKISGVLKGIRKDPRKFGSSVDRYTVNDIVYYQYSRSDLHLISHCDLKQFFYPVRKDYRRSLAANYALELVNHIMQSEQTNRDVYQLLLHYFSTLETVRDIDKLVHVFQVKMLGLSGFRPHIDSCVHCGRKITGKTRFSLKLGGLVCSQCPTTETNFVMVSKGTVASLLHLERYSWAHCMKLGLTSAVKKELKYVLNSFLVYHLERQIKTAKYL